VDRTGVRFGRRDQRDGDGEFYAILRRWPRLAWPSSAIAVLLVAAVFALPSVYQWRPSTRPLFQAYRRLTPFRELIEKPNAMLVATESDVTEFVARCRCRAMRFDKLREQTRDGVPFGEVLNRNGATIFLTDERTINDPVLAGFLANPKEYGWEPVGGKRDANESWIVFRANR
jgi:hypothetical protein